MSILKGGASIDTYSLEFVEGRGYDRFVDVNEIFFSSVWNSVTVFELQSQTLIINDRDLIGFFNVYDVNGDFIGFYSKQEYDYQSTGSTWLGDITTNMTLHPNSYFIAFNSATVTTTNWGPAVSFSQFQTLTVSYDTNPAIDNIYYGQPSQGDSYLSFDGVDDYVSTGYNPNNLNNVSSETKIKLSIASYPSSESYIFGGLSSTFGRYFLLIRPDGYLQVSLGSTANVLYDNQLLNLNQIYDITFSTNASTNQFALFIDDVSQGTISWNKTTFGSFEDVNIGASHVENQFSNINVYEFSILIGGVKQLEYLFNEGSGTTLTDSAGNNDGTIVGATWQSDTTYSTIDRVYAGGALVYGQAPTYYLLFDGVDDYLNLDGTMTGNFGSFEMVFTPLIDYPINPGTRGVIWSNDVDGNNEFIFGNTVDYSTENLQLKTTSPHEWWGFALNANQEYTMRLEHDGSTYQLYYDNNLVSKVESQNTSPFLLSQIKNIGKRYNSTLFLNAEISYIKFTDSNDNVALEYLFNEGTGSTLNDNSGNGISATIVGATWVQE